MPEIGKITTQLNGFTGAPGFSNMFFFGDPYSTATADSNADDVAAFWNGVANQMAPGFTFSVLPDVQVLDEATGALIRIETTTPAAQSIFAGTGSYAGGVGAVASWVTNGVHGTKRLRGRTFIVPLNANTYDTNGTIAAGALTTLRTATTALAAVANFGVYGRPIGGAGGDWAACTGGSVRDHVAWLSSRRD